MLAGQRPGSHGWGEDPDPLLHIDADGMERRLPVAPGDQRGYYIGLRDALQNQASMPTRGIEALATMAVIEAGFASHHERRAMPLPLTDAERELFRTAD
jgi:hypothetical protein